MSAFSHLTRPIHPMPEQVREALTTHGLAQGNVYMRIKWQPRT